MDRWPCILNDRRYQNEIEECLNQAGEAPFSQVLEQWLEQIWGENSQETTQESSTLQMMIREEDVSLLMQYADRLGKHLEVFYLLWDSGLFALAEELIQTHPEVAEQLGDPAYEDTEINEFRDRAKLAKWGLWGKKMPFPPTGAARSIMNRWFDNAFGCCIILTGLDGPEKTMLAHMMHWQCRRKNIEHIDCASLDGDPLSQIEKCQYGGTVFLDGFDSLPSEYRGKVLQTINKRKLLKEITTTEGQVTDILELDTLFILGVDRPHRGLNIHGWSVDSSDIGTRGFVCPVPSLRERIQELPLLTNQILLRLGKTKLDQTRHEFADCLLRFNHETGPHVESNWLRYQVFKCVEEFSPESIEKFQKAAPKPDKSSTSIKTLETASDTPNIFRKEGDFWRIAFSGKQAPLMKDLKGLQYIHYLLSHSSTDGVPILELVAGVNKSEKANTTDLSGGDVRKKKKGSESDPGYGRIEEEGLRISSMASNQDIIDSHTRMEIGKELNELMDQKTIYVETQNSEGEAEIDEKILQLEQYLKKNTTLTGKNKTYSDEQEKARKAVSNAFHHVMNKKIKTDLPELYQHLSKYLKISKVCTYRPPQPIHWGF